MTDKEPLPFINVLKVLLELWPPKRMNGAYARASVICKIIDMLFNDHMSEQEIHDHFCVGFNYGTVDDYILDARRIQALYYQKALMKLTTIKNVTPEKESLTDELQDALTDSGKQALENKKTPFEFNPDGSIKVKKSGTSIHIDED